MLRRSTSSHIFNFLLAGAALCVALCANSELLANNQNNNNNNNNNNANNNNNNNNGGIQAAGVVIDPDGILRVMQNNPRVTMQRLRAAKQQLPNRLARPSKLRKISLTRLEKAVADLVANGQQPTPEMITLAGMNRLEYVFFYPESGEIVLAGSAEGFGQDSVGRFVGVESGKPCLLLDDLIVALRAFGPSGDRSDFIGVSIDPTQDGLARYQSTLRSLGSTLRSPADVPIIVNSLRTSLGLNEVTITGIPANTHFAHVLTEADYRMKLIGIGLEAPPVPMSTYVSRLSAAMTSNNALIRWYFVPDYESVATSDDGLSMQMIGQGVKLIGADELVSSDGTRKASGRRANPASRAFTTDFTRKFGRIAQSSAVYSQLRNLMDMTIAAAFIQDRGLYEKANWDLGTFASEDDLPVQVFAAPKQVETAINAVMKGSRLITPIGGGVSIEPRKALQAENLQADQGGRIARAREDSALSEIPADQWWWD